MLFIVAICFKIISDLPTFFDCIVFLAGLFIIWARDEILAYHIIGFHVTTNNNKLLALFSSLLRIMLGLIVVKMMILGFFQYVLILYLIDYMTWSWSGRALSHALTLCYVERTTNESKT